MRVNTLSMCNPINNVHLKSLSMGSKSLASHTSLVTRNDPIISCHPRTDDLSLNSRGHFNDILHTVMDVDVPVADLLSSNMEHTRSHPHTPMFPSIDLEVLDTPLSSHDDCSQFICVVDHEDMCTRLNHVATSCYRDDSHVPMSIDSEIIDTSSTCCELEQLTHIVDEHICGNSLSSVELVNDVTSIPHISPLM